MRSKLSRPIKALAGGALAAALALGACQTITTEPGSDDSVIIANRDARLSILLTDAPAELNQAWVEITDIYLQVREYDGGDDDGNGNGNGENGGRVHLPLLPDGSPVWKELLALAGQFDQLVNVADIPAGTYSQLRFVIGEAAIETEAGLVYATSSAALDELEAQGLTTLEGPHGVLHCPSCSQSGIKVRFPGGAVVLESGTNEFVVDFDATQSFGHQAGNSGRWIMHPTLLATEFPGLGSISGTVRDASGELAGCTSATLSDFVPTATLQGNGVTETGAVVVGGEADEGSYTISGLPPGVYDLGFVRDVTDVDGSPVTFVGDSPPPVTVTSNTDTPGGDYVITSVSCS